VTPTRLQVHQNQLLIDDLRKAMDEHHLALVSGTYRNGQHLTMVTVRERTLLDPPGLGPVVDIDERDIPDMPA
jgi:hypothetical protein